MVAGVYPIERAEYGTYGWLKREVGGFLGKGFDASSWDPATDGKIDSLIQSGYQQFCYPPAVSEDSGSYQWTWLTPLSQIEIIAGTNTYRLPDDFSGTLKELTFTAGDETRRIAVVREADLRSLPVRNSKSGDPEYAAVRVLKSDGSSRQQYELLLYPTPANNRTLEYRYSVSPEPLGDDNPYPLGGRQYAETLLQSCLAVAEERELKTQGTASARWMERLAASIRLDVQSLQQRGEELWPTVTGDSLSVDRDYLERMIGRKMDFGPHSGAWTTGQYEQVKEALRQGLRQFYQPPVLPNEKAPHEWSFLRPLCTLTTEDAKNTYDLPESFAHLLGPLTYVPGTAMYPPVIEISEHQIRIWQQSTTATGQPTHVAILPKPLDEGTGGTRYEALLWPTPDSAYGLNYRCALNPDLLAAGNSFPFGGQPHAQTVLESCLAAAEVVGGMKSREHYQRFLVCLQASIGHDRRVNSPQTLGSASEWDQESRTWGTRHDWSAQLVTYNGAVVS